MLSWEVWLAFVSASALFAFAPGPALLFTAAQTLARGQAYGLQTVAGLHLGCYVHVFAAAAGLTVLLASVPTAYFLIKLAGAIYLCWLGLGLIIEAVRYDGTGPIADRSAEHSSARGRGKPPLLSGFIVEVFNPKTALFFYAFLPQFVNHASEVPVWLQFVILGSLVNMAFSFADVLCVVLAGWVTGTVRRSHRLITVAKGISGTILVGLGARLVADRN